MKKMLLLCLALTSVALQADSGCPLQNATLKGVYIVRNSGTVMISAGSVGAPIADLGVTTFDGQGNLQVSLTGSLNGNVVRLSSTGAYTINQDCTGSMILGTGPGATHYDVVVTSRGKQVYSIQTDNGTLTTQIFERQHH